LPIEISLFYHKSECTCDFERHPDGPDHRRCKKTVAQKLKSELKEYSTAEIIYEHPIKEAKRIADIIMKFPNGWMVAHEIQLSHITIELLEKRTEDYLNAGIDIVWWLGKSANIELNRDWCQEKFGVC
jgi:competence protein CoiA